MMHEGICVTQADGKVTWETSCDICGQASRVPDLDMQAVRAWRDGLVVQQAFPQLNADDREILVSGMHGECFDREYPGDDDDYDDWYGDDWDDDGTDPPLTSAGLP